ncbi:MAG: hypothetical protein JW819_10180 [Candidatus Krumholzibacteriota bacterium]|nr:hypothetical protein [Candidatus Krumholzibacteriota bacterium]
MDWHELQKKKVAELREMAAEEGHTGTSGLIKEQLVEWLADQLGIERPHKVVVGVDKAGMKAKIRELKTERQQALAAGDGEGLRRARRQIHRLKRRIRRGARLAR